MTGLPKSVSAARIAHRIGAMQNHERVRVVAVRVEIVDHGLPVVGCGVRGVDQRIELGEREQAAIHMRVLQQTEQPALGVGARHQAVRRINHADGAAGVRDVNAQRSTSLKSWDSYDSAVVGLWGCVCVCVGFAGLCGVCWFRFPVPTVPPMWMFFFALPSPCSCSWLLGSCIVAIWS